jgi:hypothetical protein
MIPCRALLSNQLPINNGQILCYKITMEDILPCIVSFGTIFIYIDANRRLLLE